MGVEPEQMRPPLTPEHWRLVALDIDGTVMSWGGDVSESVREAITQVRMCRNHVVLATGRNIPAMLPVAERLGIRRGYAVCSNGAVTIKLNPGLPQGYEIVEKATFQPGAALEIVRDELPDVHYAVEDSGVSFRVSEKFPMDELIGDQRVSTFEELSSGEATRVVIRAPGRDVRHFDSLIRRIGLSDVTYAVGYTAWLDLTPPGVSKATALEAVRRRLGVYPDHTVAFGDGNNDIDMLTWAANSTAMGDAPDVVKAAADAVTGTVTEDGLVDPLRSLVDPERLAMQ